jgi:hypothetical protein
MYAARVNAWAERARSCGYPERFALEALGHQSKAVHRAYAKKAQVVISTRGLRKASGSRLGDRAAPAARGVRQLVGRRGAGDREQAIRTRWEVRCLHRQRIWCGDSRILRKE